MFTALLGVNTVHEGDVLVLRQLLLIGIQVTCEHGTDLPARPTVLIGKACHAVAQEQLDKLFKGVRPYHSSIPADFYLLSDECSQFDDTSMKARNHIRKDASFIKGSRESRTIGDKGHFDRTRFRGQFSDARLFDTEHVIIPRL